MKYAHPEFLKAFGQNLRRIREEKGFGLREFATHADMEFSYLSKIELGKANPTIELAYQLSVWLEIPYQALFDFKMPPKGKK